MSIVAKVHKKDSTTVVAVCDQDLLGKLFEESGKQLDLRGEFYNGEVLDREEIGDLMRNADSVNVVGKKSIELALHEGVIEKEDVKTIKDVQYAQVSLLH